MHLFQLLAVITFLAAGSATAKPCPKKSQPGTTTPSNATSSLPDPAGTRPLRYCGTTRPKGTTGGNANGAGVGAGANSTTEAGSGTKINAGGTGSEGGSGQAKPPAPVGPVSGINGAGSSGPLLTPDDGSGSGLGAAGGSNNNNASTSSSDSTISSSSPTSSSPQRGNPSKCPAGFLNVVFNVNAGSLPGWSNNAIWESLSSAGVSNWIGFSLGQGYEDPAYGNMTPDLAATQIPICMNPNTDTVDRCMQSLTGDHPPEWMEIFNEMDYSWKGTTVTSDPQTAAKAALPIFSAKTTTKLIPPAMAYTGSSWLPQFGDACDGCMDKVKVVAGHIYQQDPQNVLNILNQFHEQWPDKDVWLTELAPASTPGDGCKMGDTEIIQYMQDLFPKIVALGYVTKIFWNNGAWVSHLRG